MRCYVATCKNPDVKNWVAVSDDRELMEGWMEKQPSDITMFSTRMPKSEYQCFCNDGLDIIIDDCFVYPSMYRPVIDCFWRNMEKELTIRYLQSCLLDTEDHKIKKSLKRVIDYLEEDESEFIVPSIHSLEEDLVKFKMVHGEI